MGKGKAIAMDRKWRENERERKNNVKMCKLSDEKEKKVGDEKRKSALEFLKGTEGGTPGQENENNY